MKRATLGVLSVFLMAGTSYGVEDTAISVCPEGYTEGNCDFIGHNAIQKAVNAAADGDVIYVKSGVYRPTEYQDVPFGEPTDAGIRQVVVRGAVAVDSKHVSIIGEEGVLLQPDDAMPKTALVVHDGGLKLENIRIEGFRVHEPEDPVYDGHGVFIINSSVDLKNIEVHDVEKMALVIREKSVVSASDIRLSESHMGVWFEEEGVLSLSNAVLKGNHTGLGVYGNTVSSVSDTVIEGSTDDGIYAIASARVTLTDTVISDNAPYGINVRDNVALDFVSGVLKGNTANVSEVPVTSTVNIAASVSQK